MRGFIGALSLSVTFALLAGCGGSQPPIGVQASQRLGIGFYNHKTFKYTSATQAFKVPTNVTQIKVVARGAAGAGDGPPYGVGGRGGRVTAILSVTPKEKLYINVGGAGSGRLGGFNGGGDGGPNNYGLAGFGGGGATDIRAEGRGLLHRILVVGGGGGAGYPLYCPSTGGRGGGSIGGSGQGASSSPSCGSGGGGGGGGQAGGGFGGRGGSGPTSSGNPGKDGKRGRGGNGGGDDGGSGGGGGAGYYGGGGGGSGANYASGSVVYGGGGGGGGSSYIEASARDVHSWRGWKNANSDGLVVLSW